MASRDILFLVEAVALPRRETWTDREGRCEIFVSFFRLEQSCSAPIEFTFPGLRSIVTRLLLQVPEGEVTGSYEEQGSGCLRYLTHLLLP